MWSWVKKHNSHDWLLLTTDFTNRTWKSHINKYIKIWNDNSSIGNGSNIKYNIILLVSTKNIAIYQATRFDPDKKNIDQCLTLHASSKNRWNSMSKSLIIWQNHFSRSRGNKLSSCLNWYTIFTTISVKTLFTYVH